MRPVCFLASLGLSVLQISLAQAADPALKAQEIALSQVRVRNILQRLREEANKVKDSRMRKDALSLLEHPVFTVVSARKAQESEIVSKLKAEDLYQKEAPPSFMPSNLAMAFVAAPGGTWSGHHAYPGGLAYHTYFNLRAGLGFARTYHEVYGVRLDQDLIRLAAIWHDSAKTMTLTWNPDGSCSSEEAQIAKTSAHHILAISEALYRKYPTTFVVTLAAAHKPPSSGSELQEFLGYLKAGAIISGVPFEAAGLSSDGKSLATLPPVEAFVNHLDDHDYVLSGTSMGVVAKALDSVDDWMRNEILSRDGDIPLYSKVLHGGSQVLQRSLPHQKK